MTTSDFGFSNAPPYFAHQPCYFGGPIAINFATNNKTATTLTTTELAKRQAARGIAGLHYWTPAMHTGSFALPAYAEDVVTKAIADGRAQGEAAQGYATLADVMGEI